MFPATRVVAERFEALASPMGGILSTLGASQSEATALIQVAAVTGVAGVTLLIGLVAALGADLLTRPLRPMLRPALAVTITGRSASESQPASCATAAGSGCGAGTGARTGAVGAPGRAAAPASVSRGRVT